MRTVLVTGPGGAGTSTVAAATALAAARAGARALLVTADPPPGLTADETPGLTVRTLDSAGVFQDRAAELQQRLSAVFELLGASPLDPEEFTELPGSREFALLHALGGTDGHDVVVADLPPVDSAVRLLALPEQLRRYLSRLLPPERQAARALRPMLAQLAGVPMPAEWLYQTAARWDAELAAVNTVIESAATTVRLVVEPGPRAAAAVRAARTGLALFGYRVESLTANRLLPTGSADPFLAALSGQQQKHLKALYEEFGADGVPVRELPHLGRDPHGPDDLAALGGPELAVGPLPDTPADQPWSVEDRLAAEGQLVWRLPLPGATRDTLDLVRRGDEVVVDAGRFRRIMRLPSALRRCTVTGAALRDGALQVRFTPDPALWPQ
ncbi:ArsA family ATPase [Streptomyces silvisoli]|uniref:ArsA-related P-loop ATPase n=1 Tax=Streptomyces silvisoli TaxID=3034235 RepID=A0ABT5ZFW3_9ACTN|nr:ArsA-related P-loop ATPase [Streptomyces silvisoli]MDF3288561.1 ArsA-related P-loop ATPase [Streptomyces silvisoli]